MNLNQIQSEEFQIIVNTDKQELAGQVSTREESASQEFVVSIDVLNEVAEMIGPDDPELLAELIDEYLADTDQLVEQMQTLLDRHDTVALQRAAHSLKSTSATFGVMPLSELCKKQEDALRDNLPDIDHGTLIQQMDLLHQRSRAELEAEKVRRLA